MPKVLLSFRFPLHNVRRVILGISSPVVLLNGKQFYIEGHDQR